MNVKSVDNRNFQSQGDRSLAAYNPRRNPRHNIDAIIALDDNSIKQLAYIKTKNTVEDNKHRKISKGMFMAIPVVAGIASALLKPAKSSLLTKDISGMAGRLLNGAKTAAVWGVLLGVAEGIMAGRNKLEKKSPELNNFTSQNPFLAFAATVGAFAGTLALGGKYIPMLAEKVLKHVKPESVLNAENKLFKGADRFNSNKIVKSISKFAGDLKNKKYLESVKGVVKTALEWSPTLLLWGGVLHSFNHNNVRNREFVRNYSEMKDYQSRLAKARIRELSMQSESINRDNQYSKDITNLKDTMSDFKEVVQVVKEIQPEAVLDI